MRAPVTGIKQKHFPERKLSWGVITDVQIDNERFSPSSFWETENEADIAFDTAVIVLAQKRAEAQARKEAGQVKQAPLPAAPKGTELFETLANKWLETRVRARKRASTYRGWRNNMHLHLFPHMRTWPVTQAWMTPERLTTVLGPTLRQQGRTVETRKACHRCLSAFFKWVVVAGAPSQFPSRINPMTGLLDEIVQNDELAEVRKKRKEQTPNPMTKTQVEWFLGWQQTHYPELYELWLWQAYQGTRIGEAVALKWDHIETFDERNGFKDGKAHIQETFSDAQLWLDRLNGLEGTLGETETKTGNLHQYIDLHPLVGEALFGLRARNGEAWLKSPHGYGKRPAHVFLNSKFRPRRKDKKLPHSFHAACNAMKAAARTLPELKDGVGPTGKHFTIHCLRDTFVTLSILGGKDYFWVANQIGHSNIDTLKKHYLKWVRLVDENPMKREAQR